MEVEGSLRFPVIIYGIIYDIFTIYTQFKVHLQASGCLTCAGLSLSLRSHF